MADNLPLSLRMHPILRASVVSIDTVFNALNEHIEQNKNVRDENKFVRINGHEIKANSQRYKLFMQKGITCVKCQRKATHFALERHPHDRRFHLNLYAGTPGGDDEVLFTKDHIIPKSLGGKDYVSNYQTMCKPCNEAKGNTLDAQQ